MAFLCIIVSKITRIKFKMVAIFCKMASKIADTMAWWIRQYFFLESTPHKTYT